MQLVLTDEFPRVYHIQLAVGSEHEVGETSAVVTEHSSAVGYADLDLGEVEVLGKSGPQRSKVLLCPDFDHSNLIGGVQSCTDGEGLVLQGKGFVVDGEEGIILEEVDGGQSFVRICNGLALIYQLDGCPRELGLDPVLEAADWREGMPDEQMLGPSLRFYYYREIFLDYRLSLLDGHEIRRV